MKETTRCPTCGGLNDGGPRHYGSWPYSAANPCSDPFHGCLTCCSLERGERLNVTRKGHKIPLGVPETEKYVIPCPSSWHEE